MLAFVVDACIIAKDCKVLKFISCNSHAQLNVGFMINHNNHNLYYD